MGKEILILTVLLCFIFLCWIGSLKDKITELKLEKKKLEEPREVWCYMRGKVYCYGYAIPVMLTSDGLVFPPSDSEKRVVTLITELQAQGIEVILGAPDWKFVHSLQQGDVNHVYMLGAMYCIPKQKEVAAE